MHDSTRVLLVAEPALLRRLHGAGAAVTHTSSATTAQFYLESEAFQAVLVDGALPDAAVDQVLAAARRTRALVLLLAAAESAALAACVADGRADAIVAVPDSVDSLYELVATVVTS